MKTLYFDCFAGASGNMILGGLVSLGADREALINGVKKLKVSDFDIEFTEVNRAGISSIHAKTVYQEEKTHRHLSDIKSIIENSELSALVKNRAIEIFANLAKAEAKVHGTEIEKVHFHEVGAMDAIIDVVGACVGFELLGIEQFVCSKIHVGSGFINIAHGKYPVPPPAVTELLNNIPFYATEIEGELITPTGAAIISTLCDEFVEISGFEAEEIGYGAGTREYDNFPNTLRLIIGRILPQRRSGAEIEGQEQIKYPNPKTEVLTLIETNIDDISPEILGFVIEKAFDLGALDCWFTQIQMKKNRPAMMISILCNPSDKEKFAELLYTETSTLGVRIAEIERECLKREIRSIETEFGVIAVKIARYRGKITSVKPEYEDLRNIAHDSVLPLKEVERRVALRISEIIEEK